MILHRYDGFSNLDCIKATFVGVITKTFLVFTFYKFQLSSFYCICFLSLKLLLYFLCKFANIKTLRFFISWVCAPCNYWVVSNIYIFHMGLYNSHHCFIKSLGVVVCNNCTIVKFDVVTKADACESSMKDDFWPQEKKPRSTQMFESLNHIKELVRHHGFA
jgi:hypothetical protein